jgi:hypothetical protein
MSDGGLSVCRCQNALDDGHLTREVQSLRRAPWTSQVRSEVSPLRRNSQTRRRVRILAAEMGEIPQFWGAGWTLKPPGDLLRAPMDAEAAA